GRHQPARDLVRDRSGQRAQLGPDLPVEFARVDVVGQDGVVDPYGRLFQVLGAFVDDLPLEPGVVAPRPVPADAPLAAAEAAAIAVRPILVSARALVIPARPVRPVLAPEALGGAMVAEPAVTIRPVVSR